MENNRADLMKQALKENSVTADAVRRELSDQKIICINLISSPGSGKTSILERTAIHFPKKLYAIAGDIYTDLDSKRLREAGIPSYQINTGDRNGECHLESSWIKDILKEIDLGNIRFLFIENIGNLICPTGFDVGAHYNGTIISVTEGENVALKYPFAFKKSQFCLISKVDLLRYLDVNMQNMINNIKKANPQIKIILHSSKTREGMDEWIAYLKNIEIKR